MTTHHSTRALLHVRDNVLGYDETSAFWTFCIKRGITKMTQLLACDDAALLAVYKTEGEADFILPAAVQQEILMLRRWIGDQDEPTIDSWLSLSEESFETYAQENADYVPAPDSAALVSAAAAEIAKRTSHTVSPPNTAYDPYERNVKPSVNDYPTITDESKLLSWLEEVRPIAAFHQAADVLDPEYVPTTDTEQRAFDLRQKFMFAMLSAKVKYGDGELIVRDHARTSDAQAIFVELLEHTATGLSGVHYADMIEEEIKHMRFQPGLESGRQFLTKFQNRLIDLEDARLAVDSTDSVAARDKRKWLEKAIRHANDDCKLALAGVEAQEGHAEQQMSWKKFYKFIHGSLTKADLLREEEKAETARLGNTQRQANQTGTERASDEAQGDDTDGQHRGDRRGKHSKSSYRQKLDKFIQRCKDTGFYVEPNVWNSWDDARKSAHTNRRKTAWATADAGTTTGANRNTERNANTTETTPAAATSATTPAPAAAPETPPAATPAAPTTAAPAAETGSANVDRSINQLMSRQIAQTRQVRFGGSTTRNINVGTRHVHVHEFEVARASKGQLMDAGCDGGLAGDDCVKLQGTGEFADVNGVGPTPINDVEIALCATKLMSRTGPVIGLLPQYAYRGTGPTIHSRNQMLAFGCTIDDVPRTLGGNQMYRTPDGTEFDMETIGGLCYQPGTKPTEEDLDGRYPGVYLCGDGHWDPSILDCGMANLRIANDTTPAPPPSASPAADGVPTDGVLSREAYVSLRDQLAAPTALPDPITVEGYTVCKTLYLREMMMIEKSGYMMDYATER